MMRTDEEIKKDLKALSDEAVEVADKLCEIFKRFPAIDAGTAETEEEKEKLVALRMEMDRRRAIILRRILIEYSGLLFI